MPFVHLSWELVSERCFTMFRRAQLLTVDCVMPRCTRLRPPALRVLAS